jgi:hypothetical protein
MLMTAILETDTPAIHKRYRWVGSDRNYGPSAVLAATWKVRRVRPDLGLVVVK